MFSRTEGLADGPTTGGRAGPEATTALPILAALLPAAANQGHPGALQTCCQAGGSQVHCVREGSLMGWGGSGRESGQGKGSLSGGGESLVRDTGSQC